MHMLQHSMHTCSISQLIQQQQNQSPQQHQSQAPNAAINSNIVMQNTKMSPTTLNNAAPNIDAANINTITSNQQKINDKIIQMVAQIPNTTLQKFAQRLIVEDQPKSPSDSPPLSNSGVSGSAVTNGNYIPSQINQIAKHHIRTHYHNRSRLGRHFSHILRSDSLRTECQPTAGVCHSTKTMQSIAQLFGERNSEHKRCFVIFVDYIVSQRSNCASTSFPAAAKNSRTTWYMSKCPVCLVTLFLYLFFFTQEPFSANTMITSICSLSKMLTRNRWTSVVV